MYEQELFVDSTSSVGGKLHPKHKQNSFSYQPENQISQFRGNRHSGLALINLSFQTAAFKLPVSLQVGGFGDFRRVAKTLKPTSTYQQIAALTRLMSTQHLKLKSYDEKADRHASVSQAKVEISTTIKTAAPLPVYMLCPHFLSASLVGSTSLQFRLRRSYCHQS